MQSKAAVLDSIPPEWGLGDEGERALLDRTNEIHQAVALEDTEGNQVVTLEEKKGMVCRAAFPYPPADLAGPLPHSSNKIY